MCGVGGEVSCCSAFSSWHSSHFRCNRPSIDDLVAGSMQEWGEEGIQGEK